MVTADFVALGNVTSVRRLRTDCGASIFALQAVEHFSFLSLLLLSSGRKFIAVYNRAHPSVGEDDHSYY